MKQFIKFMFASFFGVILAGIIFLVISLSIIGAIISSTSKTQPPVKEDSVLVIKLDKPIYDREISNFSAGLGIGGTGIDASNSVGLTEFIEVINHAKNDPKIKAIMLDLSMIQANGWATIQELRDALEDFKSSKKKIYAYSDSYLQNSYYLSTVADEIHLNPVGHVELKGLGAEILFIRDMLTKLDIDIDLIRPKNNAYKSAGEMYINDRMSPENKTQVKEYISSIWEHIAANISKSRNIDIKTLNDDVSSLKAFMPQDALKNKFVDVLGFRSDLEEKIGKELKNEKIKFVQYSNYRQSITNLFPSSKEKIAVIYAYGGVSQGKGSDLSIGSDAIVKEIRKAVKSSSIKAIVLRINSGGGDAIASELMTNEVIKASKVKPIVVSMGDVAASAGYEMACGATKILATPVTITGSIGVFGVLPNVSKTLKKNLGISFDTIKTHDNSTFLTVTTTMTPDSRLAMQRNVESFYQNFITRVAVGRKLRVDFVDSIARGRVWAAEDAKHLGLIDDYGGIKESIRSAAELAKIKDYSIVMLPKTKDFAEQVLEMVSGGSQANLLRNELGKSYDMFLELKDISEIKGVQARLPYMINF